MDEEMKRKLRTHVGCKIIEALGRNQVVTARMLRRIQTAHRMVPTNTHGIGRFVFGGVVEKALHWALRDLGFRVTDVSHMNLIDLSIGMDETSVDFSVKGTASLTSGIILKNFHGNRTGSVEALPPTIIVRMNYKDNCANILFLTQSIIDAVDYIGKRTKGSEKIKINDATVTLQNAFLVHLVRTLGPDFSLTVPLPANAPLCELVDVNELIMRHVDQQLGAHDAQQTQQHSHSPSSPVACMPPCLTDGVDATPENFEDAHTPEESDISPCPPQSTSVQSQPASETSLHS